MQQVSIGDAANNLQIPQCWLAGLVRTGAIKSNEVDGDVFVDAKTIADWEATQPVAPSIAHLEMMKDKILA